MLAANPYRTQGPRSGAGSLGAKEGDGTDSTSVVSDHTRNSYQGDVDDDSMDKPLLQAFGSASNPESDEEMETPSPDKTRRPSLSRNASERSRTRAKSKERPRRSSSGQGLRGTKSGSGTTLTSQGQSPGGEKENTSGKTPPSRRKGLFKSLSFSDRGARKSLKKSSSFAERQKRTGTDSEEDTSNKKKTLEASNSTRPTMPKRTSSCRDLRSSQSGFGADGDKHQLWSSKYASADQKENLDTIQHLEAKTELYKEEFKRVVQEKKQILSSYVAETAELTEEITMIRKMLFASEEENRKLKAALHEAGIQPSTLAALTESDGLPKTSFDELTSNLSSATRNSLNAPSGQEQASAKKNQEYSCHVAKGPSVLLTQVHRPRPSLFQLPGLRTLPFWTQSMGIQTEVAYQEPSLTWAVQYLEKNWEKIAKEYKKVAPSMSADSYSYKGNTTCKSTAPEHVMQKGKCSLRSYMKEGTIQSEFEEKFARTTEVLQVIHERGLLFERIPFGSVYFSNLKPKSRVATHSSSMNLRLRLHLPIILPDESGNGVKKSASNDRSTTSLDSASTHGTNNQDNPRPLTKKLSNSSLSTGGCGLRVGALHRKYEIGRAILLDDSYDHESWNDTDRDRVVLIVDLWHPDVTPQERMAIVAHTSKNYENRTGYDKHDSDDSPLDS